MVWGGLIGGDEPTYYYLIDKCYYNSDSNSEGIAWGSPTGVTGKSISELQNQTFLESLGFTAENGWIYSSGTSNPVLHVTTSGSGGSGGSGGEADSSDGTITLQIGIDSSQQSNITLNMGLNKNLLVGLTGLDISGNNTISAIDAIIQNITSKQTELGAIQNRLESVLDSISIQYENLVSARSTIRDADVAKESAAYIKAQILQNVSATLLATANQSPSHALALINGLQRR